MYPNLWHLWPQPAWALRDSWLPLVGEKAKAGHSSEACWLGDRLPPCCSFSQPSGCLQGHSWEWLPLALV